MKSALQLSMVLVGMVAFVANCGETEECTRLACLEAVEFAMVNPDGEPVQVFSGSVTVDDITYEFACNTAYPNVEGPLECGEAAVRMMGMATENKTYFVTVISDTNGYHSKMVEPTYGVDTNFNGPGCGECAFGTAELVLVE